MNENTTAVVDLLQRETRSGDLSTSPQRGVSEGSIPNDSHDVKTKFSLKSLQKARGGSYPKDNKSISKKAMIRDTE